MNHDIRNGAVWCDGTLERSCQRGHYIAVSGNTGSGKSTLVKSLAAELSNDVANLVAIDERSLHHPFLTSMFYSPRKYSFGIQLNFLLQRYLALTRWFDAGYSVIIERSHLDDSLFIDHHREAGHITQSQYTTYQNLSAELHSLLPAPDVLIYLEVTPDVSLHRIREGELTGARPEEFPNEESKREYVESWYLRYRSFYAQLSDSRNKSDTRILPFVGARDTAETVQHAADVIRQVVKPGSA